MPRGKRLRAHGGGSGSGRYGKIQNPHPHLSQQSHGGIADRAALEKIASFAEKHDLLVISDEIYAELTYGQKHVSFASLPRMKERTAYVGGFSKAFAMDGVAGWATSARPRNRRGDFQNSSVFYPLRPDHRPIRGRRGLEGRFFRRFRGRRRDARFL